jgi:hypothetical protein
MFSGFEAEMMLWRDSLDDQTAELLVLRTAEMSAE